MCKEVPKLSYESINSKLKREGIHDFIVDGEMYDMEMNVKMMNISFQSVSTKESAFIEREVRNRC